MTDLFDGFDTRTVDTGAASIHLRVAGQGAPLVLLHGFPQTHAAWHKVAGALARSFTVVVPDLRGYGRSKGPVVSALPGNDHSAYAKRAMAQDVLAVMQSLGFSKFGLAGHDRGARVGVRLALDVPEALTRFAPIDIVPTIEMWEKMAMAGALRSYHWSFLAQPAPMPETLIGGASTFYLHHLLRRWSGNFDAIHPQALAEYEAAFARPEVIAANCEDYRAGATLDVEHDRADREAGRRLQCPTLVVWGQQYLASVSPLATWRKWVHEGVPLQECALPCGHLIAEEKPDELLQALQGFFG